MNGKDLLMGLGHVDEVYIQAAEEKTLRKPFGTALRRYGGLLCGVDCCRYGVLYAQPRWAHAARAGCRAP